MTFDDYSILVRKLYELNIKQQEYIDKIPLDIRDAFFDNEYTAAYSVMLTVVMRAALEPELFDDLQWLLYEWKPGAVISVDGVDYPIHTVDDYIAFSKVVYYG